MTLPWRSAVERSGEMGSGDGMQTCTRRLFFFKTMSTVVARAYVGGDDQAADIGNEGGRIIRAAFLGSI